MFQRFAKFLEVREATDDEITEAFEHEQVDNGETDVAALSAAVDELSLDSQRQYQQQYDDSQAIANQLLLAELQGQVESDTVYDSSAVQEQLDDWAKPPPRLDGVKTDDQLDQTTIVLPSGSHVPQAEILDEVGDRLSEVSLDSNDENGAGTKTPIVSNAGSPGRSVETASTPRHSTTHSQLPSNMLEEFETVRNQPGASYENHQQYQMPHEHYQNTADCSAASMTTMLSLEPVLAQELLDDVSSRTDKYDEILKNWATLEGTPLAIPSPSQQIYATQYENFQAQGVIDQNESHIAWLQSQLAEAEQRHQADLQRYSDRIFFLETELSAAERSRIELEDTLKEVQAEHSAEKRSMATQIEDLSCQLQLVQAKSLTVDLLANHTNASAATGLVSPDELLKHCTKLVRRMESEEPASDSSKAQLDGNIARLAGKQMASMAAKVALCEQQIKDEKLVLKNLFISWIERGERKDAFEILARAFDFTDDDRKRLEKKSTLARGAAMGVKWSLSESIADFVRDETS